MAPRGRPKRPGTSRMDAAVDAMTPFGFPKDLVCAKMNALLKVYGGQSGYPFIEADAYKVLIEALLGSEDGGEQGEEEGGEQGERKSINCAEGETSMKDDSFGNEGVGDHTAVITDGPTGGSIESIGSETPNAQVLTYTRGDGSSWKDIILDQTCSQDGRMGEEAADNMHGYSVRVVHLHDPPVCSPPPSITSSPVLQSIPSRRRKPCYGWISDGEEKDSFVILTPAVIPPPTPTVVTNVTVKRTKRKTRWDIGPE